MSSPINSNDKSTVCKAFVSFLRTACLLADDSHWYSIRGTYSNDSLLILTFLSPRDYATLLLVAGLLQVGGGKRPITITSSDSI